MTTNLKVLMSVVASAATAVMLFVSVPASPDLRDPSNVGVTVPAFSLGATNSRLHVG
jgi:hypothetical protein